MNKPILSKVTWKQLESKSFNWPPQPYSPRVIQFLKTERPVTARDKKSWSANGSILKRSESAKKWSISVAMPGKAMTQYNSSKDLCTERVEENKTRPLLQKASLHSLRIRSLVSSKPQKMVDLIKQNKAQLSRENVPKFGRSTLYQIKTGPATIGYQSCKVQKQLHKKYQLGRRMFRVPATELD